MNTFKDNFFSASQSETINTAQFKEGQSYTYSTTGNLVNPGSMAPHLYYETIDAAPS